MFTGLVQTIGTVCEISATPSGAKLRVDSGGWGHIPTVGESISVAGCCLTLVQPVDNQNEPRLVFDVVAETLKLTTLGELKSGSPVNLEASVTPDTLLGGHLVQGHIDGVGTVTHVQTDPQDYRVTITPPQALMPMMVPKGSVAVDGVSLTIATVTDSSFAVALIPTTLEETTLSTLTVGDRVNLESDMIARAVVHAVNHLQIKSSP